jgi:hypothetical protein
MEYFPFLDTSGNSGYRTCQANNFKEIRVVLQSQPSQFGNRGRRILAPRGAGRPADASSPPGMLAPRLTLGAEGGISVKQTNLQDAGVPAKISALQRARACFAGEKLTSAGELLRSAGELLKIADYRPRLTGERSQGLQPSGQCRCSCAAGLSCIPGTAAVAVTPGEMLKIAEFPGART